MYYTKNTMKNKLFRGFGILLILCLIGIAGGSFYMLSYSLTPDKGQNDEDRSYQKMVADYPFLEKWVDSLRGISALRDTFIVNREGIRLHAYYIAAGAPTSRTAVVVHGYTDNAVRMFMIGYMYERELGYNVLLPDLQYHGRSEGKAIQMGWKDRLDVMEWINVADQIFGGHTHMVVHGISMGAVTTMMLSGEVLPACVKCFVEDCGYTSVWEQFSKELKEQFGLPAFPLLYTASWFCDWKYGWNFQEASAIRQVEKCQLPMLFTHGDQDAYVLTEMVYDLYKAKPEPKQLWIVPGAAHAVSYKENPKAYTEKVRAFLERYN